MSALISANILPRECSRGVSGTLIERKRRIEREQIKEGLRVWLERKALQIRSQKVEDGVRALVWRFSRKMKIVDNRKGAMDWPEGPRKEKVTSLKSFWENLNP